MASSSCGHCDAAATGACRGCGAFYCGRHGYGGVCVVCYERRRGLYGCVGLLPVAFAIINGILFAMSFEFIKERPALPWIYGAATVLGLCGLAYTIRMATRKFPPD